MAQELNVNVQFKYHVESDLLTCLLPDRMNQVASRTAILPFSKDDGVHALSVVFYVGYNEELDEITGELVGIEFPYFHEGFKDVRRVLKNRIRKAIPHQHGEDEIVCCDEKDVNLSILDRDIKCDNDTVVFLVALVDVLEHVWFGTCEALQEARRSREELITVGAFSTFEERRIEEHGLRGQLVLA